MSNVINLFHTDTDHFRNFEEIANVEMAVRPINEALQLVSNPPYSTLINVQNTDRVEFIRRFNLMRKYASKLLDVFTVPFADTRYTLVIDRDNEDLTCFNILMETKEHESPFIIRVEVYHDVEFTPTPENPQLHNFVTPAYELLNSNMHEVLEKDIEYGVCTAHETVYNLGALTYNLTHYNYNKVGKDNVIIGILSIM